MPGESGYQLSPFEVGQIKAHVHHGLGPAAIARILLKQDGESKWSVNTIESAINKLKKQPSWRGEREPGSGAPRKTTAKQDDQIVDFVLDNRGKRKITVKSVKRQFPELRQLSNSLVEDRLDDAELASLRRRKKSKVGTVYLQGRVDYCNWVLIQKQSTLNDWAYTDGTVYYQDASHLCTELWMPGIGFLVLGRGTGD